MPTVVDEPTTEEWAVLRALAQASRLHGSPTLSEIAWAMSPPSNNARVYRAIQRLVIKGWVAHLPYRARGIRLLRQVPREQT